MTDNNSIAEELPNKPGIAEAEAPKLVGVRFRSCGKVYTFNANNLELKQGTRVVVESDMGQSLGFVVMSREKGQKPKEPLKKIIRIATEKDLEAVEQNRGLQEEAKAFCVEKSRDLKLPMKIVTTEITLDKKRLVFYFTADGRIDFRELVRDLASKFKTRIEMRQIGVRDEVKMLGGIGCCGRETCCSQFLTSFEPITIRMAKQQALSINQSKLSGICGRLMCCLGYEYREGAGPAEPHRKKRNDSPAHVKSEEPKKPEQDADEIVIHKDGDKKPLSPESTEKPAAEPQKGRTEQSGEHVAKENKPSRRSRGRRRRKKPDAAASTAGAPQKEQREPVRQNGSGQTEKAGQDNTKGTSKSFNKRKKFWKKKKKKIEE